MDIEAIYVHRVIKERHKPAFKKGSGNQLLTSDPLVIELINRIKEIYKTGKTFGTFNSDEKNYPFQQDLKAHLDNPAKLSMKDLSSSVIKKLIIEMNKEPLATGGYMLFFHFKDAGKEWFFVVMLKDKKGFLFNDELELKDIDELDLDKLHQAIRVDIEAWKAKSEKAYLSFIKSGSGDIASYFLHTFGCTDSIPSKVSTSAIFDVIKKVARDNSIEPRKARMIEDSVADFLLGYKTEISLERLANYVDLQFDEDLKGIFIEKANSEEYSISDTFLPDRTTLNKYKKLISESNFWKISIDRQVIGESGNKLDSNKDVLYDKEQKAITIKNLPKQTIIELEELFKEKPEKDEESQLHV